MFVLYVYLRAADGWKPYSQAAPLVLQAPSSRDAVQETYIRAYNKFHSANPKAKQSQHVYLR
uniref:Uncharacterized protein n=1 Tax=Arundo donax TaxID=35708 RepID=A0A0A9HCJ5_ARUDO